MTDIVLFHHAQGLTDGVRQFAGQLRAAGHQVTTPDLYEGQVFGSLPEGLAYVEQAGFDTILERGRLAAQDLPASVVYAGFSLGVMPAQLLAQTRPGARGALFFHSCLPVSEFGSWPDGVPVQIHAMEADPFFTDEGDIDAARDLVKTAERRRAVPVPGGRAPVRGRQPGRLRPGRRGAAHRAGPRVPGPRRRGWRAMRVEPARDAGERDMLGQYLDYQRATMLAKADGLTREQLARPHPPSSLTLAGLLYHLALVEESWMVARFAGRRARALGGHRLGRRPGVGVPHRDHAGAGRRSASATGRPASAAARWPPRPRTWTSCPWPSGTASTSRCAGCCCTCWRRRPGTPGTPT